MNYVLKRIIIEKDDVIPSEVIGNIVHTNNCSYKVNHKIVKQLEIWYTYKEY